MKNTYKPTEYEEMISNLIESKQMLKRMRTLRRYPEYRFVKIVLDSMIDYLHEQKDAEVK